MTQHTLTRTLVSGRPLASLGLALALTLAAGCSGDKEIEGDDDGADDDGGGDDGGDDGGGDDGGTAPNANDPGGDIASALEAELDGGSFEYEDAIDTEGDRDFYKFALEEGQIMGFGSLAYAFTATTTPDTVLRLYGSDGTLLATNDDMPYRAQETDSALYFQAPADGDYYVEVLEWSDWDEGTEAMGGSEYEYVLFAFEVDMSDPEPDNDTVDGINDWTAGEDNFVYYGSAWADFLIEFYADMDAEDDCDLFPFSFTKDSEGAYYAWNMWPTWYGDLDVTWRIYDGAMNLLAERDNPLYSVERSGTHGSFFYDFGMLLRVEEDDYYLEVCNNGGPTGTGSFYAGVIGGYTEALAEHEGTDTDSNNVASGSSLEMTESTSTAGYYFGRYAGNIDTSAVPVDTLDSIKISAGELGGGGLEGRKLSVWVNAETYGSLLDAKIGVYDDTLTLITEVSGNDFDTTGDPSLLSYELPTASTIYVTIEAESASDVAPLANNYFALVVVEE